MMFVAHIVSVCVNVYVCDCYRLQLGLW